MKAKLLAGFMLVLAFAGCQTQQTRHIQATCKTVQQYFGSNSIDENKCVNDADYRNQLVSRRDAQWSQQFSEDHNRKASVMLPKTSTDQYVRISRLSELPLKGTVNPSGGEADRHVGERFVIAGTIAEQGDRKENDSLVFYADDGDRKDFILVSTDAVDGYQRAFINDYCWLNLGDETSSMCHGDVYLSMRHQPDGVLITTELDGAAFTPATAASVLSVLAKAR